LLDVGDHNDYFLPAAAGALNRRAFLQTGSVLLVSSGDTPQSRLGVTTTSYLTACRSRDTCEFLEYCQASWRNGTTLGVLAHPAL
jgi:hypothetical protein